MTAISPFCVAVIGHSREALDLPKGYIYLERQSDLKMTPDLESAHQFLAPAYVWSEYAAWFENSKLLLNCELAGLFHYRCALSVKSNSHNLLPNFYRGRFLNKQRKQFSKLSNFLAVGSLNVLDGSVWDQFQQNHPDLLQILELACAKYDALCEQPPGTSKFRLQKLTGYYPRNIFLTDSSFMQDWMKTSFEIATHLDSKSKNFPNDRWGGFVLERIFTLFVIDFHASSNVSLKEFQQIYFVDFQHYFKANLLRRKFVRVALTTVNGILKTKSTH
jgi:hypothetical protein